MVGGFIVNKELLYEFSRVLYGAKDSEMARYRHGGTEIPYLDSECPTFSQYTMFDRMFVNRQVTKSHSRTTVYHQIIQIPLTL